MSVNLPNHVQGSEEQNAWHTKTIGLSAEEILVNLLLWTIFLILAITFFLQRSRKKHQNLPPSPGFVLPIIGHLHLLKKPTHKTLRNLSQKYGPIISLRLGSHLAVVVSSPSAVEECFAKNDIVLANRPPFTMGKYVYYNNTTLGTASYGYHWRNLRRICMTEILSSNRLNGFSGIRRDEVNILLRRLHLASCNGTFAKVDLRPMLTDLTLNLTMRMITEKRYFGEDANGLEESKQFREIIEENFEISSGITSLVDFFPILKWIDFNGCITKLIKFGKKADSFLQGLVDEHRRDGGRDTMINHPLVLQESQPEYCADEVIKGLILMILLGGTETSASSLEWAIANLLNHPHILKTAEAELDAQIGQDRLMEESDISNLPYLQCIILENLRLYPVAPMLVPHLSSEDCTIGGYRVPAGTMLLPNAWAIHRDPELWDDPTSFKPERFENGKPAVYKLVPFGMGRRACPGESLAYKVMSLTLGSLIQCFEWKSVEESQLIWQKRWGQSCPNLSHCGPCANLDQISA